MRRIILAFASFGVSISALSISVSVRRNKAENRLENFDLDHTANLARRAW